jgi:hypothetical protein
MWQTQATSRTITTGNIMRLITLWLLILMPTGLAFSADRKQVTMREVLDLGKVTSIKVLSLPEEVLVRAGLTPDLLIANYRSYLDLDRSTPRWKMFEESMERTVLEPTDERADYRWAILFRDAQRRTEHTLAVDRLKRVAEFDGKRYRMRGNLFDWLKSQRRLLIPR